MIPFAFLFALLIRIPEGQFTMGRTRVTPDDSTGMRPKVLLDDRPDRRVSLHAFELDPYEITNAQYAAFAKATGHRLPYHWQGGSFPAGEDKIPVYNVSWHDADTYCRWEGKRLPTEAEWERAARGGLEGQDYPNGDKIDAKQARFNIATGPGPVGAFPPNAFGLYDMAGNVSEWCADWFNRDYYKHAPAKDPSGPATGEYKVIRGGAWSDPPRRLTVFFRNWVRPEQRSPNIGFRCAR